MDRGLRAWVIFSAALLGGLSLCAWKLAPGFLLVSIGDVVQTALPLLLAGVMLANVLVTRGRTRVFWSIALGGAGLWFLASAMWTQYEVFLRKPVPVPFIGDVLFFLHIVPFTAAMAVRPHRSRSQDRLHVGGIDFLMLLTWWLYLYFFLVIPYQYVAPDKVVYSTNFNVLYTIENAVLVTGFGLLWRRTTGGWRAIYANLFGASALYVLGSQVLNHAITRNTYYTGSAYDIPLAAAMCWFVGTSIHALTLRPQPMQEPGTTWHAIAVARLAMLATLSMPVIGVLGMFVHRPPQHSVVVFRICVTLGAMFVLPFLLFLKQHRMDRELVRLLRVSEHNLEMRKQLQAQLVQTEKLNSLAYLVAGAAHEINNPLTAILGYSDLLHRDVSLMPHAREFAKKIGEQARRTKELVSDLLKFGRQAKPQKELVDLNSIVENAVELRKLDISGGVEITQQLDPALPMVNADPSQMLQVCFDIVGNALEAVHQVGGGTLSIRSWTQDGSAHLQFKDSGPGVKNPTKIFDPFYTTKPVGHGTGLGLSAAYGIVREHGGVISCESDGESGATFKIMLPAYIHEPAPALAAHAVAAQ